MSEMTKRHYHRRWHIEDINLQKRVELGTVLSLLQSVIDEQERCHEALHLKSYMSSLSRGIAQALREVQEQLLRLCGEIP